MSDRLKVGMVGIGSIAQKAYLPVLGVRSDVDLLIASRNQEVIRHVGRQYRIQQQFSQVDELIGAGVDAVFVHTSTESHAAIMRLLIANGIPVFVDKPIAYTLSESEAVVSYAKQKGVPVMVGFNRRFAPMYREMKNQISQPETILMQKNRVNKVSEVRKTLFDDYIHVADTMLYYMERVDEIEFRAKAENGLLQYVAVDLFGGGTTAVGIMNRQTGVTEESLEIMGDQAKMAVYNLSRMVAYEQDEERNRSFDDWDPILYRRGFTDMIEHFLDCVRNGREPETSGERALPSHEVVETIAARLGR